MEFSGEPLEPLSPEQQEVITAQALADEAFDPELLERLEVRRKARREKRARSESFPSHLPRRVRVIDLPEDEKAGLKLLGVKVTERLRFEKPRVTFAWLLVFPFGALLGLAYLAWTVIHFEAVAAIVSPVP